MANKQHAQFSDENGNLFYLESETEDVLDPSGKPLSDGGDLSEASVKFSVDTSRKLPQSGGRFKAFLGSIVKYLTDLGAAAYLAVANNDTTTQPGFVGDARVLKQHRDAINQLSSELYQETTETNSMNLVDAVNFICNNLELQKSFRKVFQCLNGWYSLDTIKSSGGVCSGFLSSLTTSEAYSFYKGGADAVLKKLGNATITFTTELHGSGWAATRIVKPDGYSKVDVNLSRGSGSVYGYKPDDSGTPYGTVLGTLTTAVQTFDVSEYTEIGIRVDGNNSNAKTVFY